jgi:probable rRNA maturation factor
MIQHLITVSNNYSKTRLTKKYFEAMILKILNAMDVRKAIDLSLLIIDDTEMKVLNKRYRGIDDTTDVLSFGPFPDSNKADNSSFVLPPGDTQRVAEIVISYERAKRQAEEREASLKDELHVLIVHGILHILGYDHEAEADARKMQNREKNILASLSE